MSFGKRGRYFHLFKSSGKTCIEGPVAGPELMTRLERDFSGVKAEYQPMWLDKLPKDEYEWPYNGHLLIRGEIVQPRPVEVATKYELPE